MSRILLTLALLGGRALIWVRTSHGVSAIERSQYLGNTPADSVNPDAASAFRAGQSDALLESCCIDEGVTTACGRLRLRANRAESYVAVTGRCNLDRSARGADDQIRRHGPVPLVGLLGWRPGAHRRTPGVLPSSRMPPA